MYKCDRVRAGKLREGAVVREQAAARLLASLCVTVLLGAL